MKDPGRKRRAGIRSTALLVLLLGGLALLLSGRFRDPETPALPTDDGIWRPPGSPAPRLEVGGNGPNGAEEPDEVDVTVTTNVPGARVRLVLHVAGREGTSLSREEVADGEGRAEFPLREDAARVHHIVACAQADGYMVGEQRVRFGRAHIELRPGVQVPGTVRSRSGLPLKGAFVLHPATGAVAWTGEDGSFTLSVPSPGPAEIRVGHPGHLPFFGPVDLRPTGISLVLEEGLSVHGMVRLETGAPLTGVMVTGPTSSARTDAAGRYVLSGLPPGPVRIQCEVDETCVEAEAGGTAPDLVVGGPVVRLRFLDEEGRPFCGASFEISARADGTGSEISWDYLQESSFTRSVPAGSEVEVRAAAPGFLPVSWSSGRPLESGETVDVEMRFEPALPTRREIRVSYPDGTSPRLVEVLALDAAGRLVASERAPLDASGTGTLTLPVYRHLELRVRDAASPLLATDLHRVAPEESAEDERYEAVLPAGAVIVVREVRGVPHVDCEVYSAGGERLPVAFRKTVPADRRSGLVSVGRVPPGSYRLRARSGRSVLTEVPFTVRSGEDTVEVSLD